MWIDGGLPTSLRKSFQVWHHLRCIPHLILQLHVFPQERRNCRSIFLVGSSIGCTYLYEHLVVQVLEDSFDSDQNIVSLSHGPPYVNF